jgi:hypothetical protein
LKIEVKSVKLSQGIRFTENEKSKIVTKDKDEKRVALVTGSTSGIGMGIAIFMFYLGFGFLFSHELDAMVQAEWRLLYVLRSMPDETAMPIFVWLHVPFFALIVWLTHHSKQQIQIQSRNVFATFLIVHAGLHYRLSNHPLYTFDTILSKTLIYGGAICGAAYLVIRFIVTKWRVIR